ncbi:hypothetical protein [Pseudomonas sp. LP_7_YM]|uniref:hypothetical protein n=1 Tax=Pseudomonas sp. LP_7_YM TaxID=2485137 RepID=UPI00105BCB7A|nr:hypothetical protein [Pseudomonas sp. LP_7_YM]TDV63304.1 hypothetical protein EC915_10663 [Pseudomonas sp. LP_7_YM]
MSVLLTAAEMRLTKQANAYQIKNPNQVETEFTITSESKAAQTLKLNDQSKINDLKDFLKSYDMTNISTDELKKVGAELYKNGLIDDNVFSSFIGGDRAFDVNGEQTDTDKKFNAIAMFNEMLADNTAYNNEYPQYANQDSAIVARQGLIGANQAISALAYFANSGNSTLAVHEKA